MTQMQDHFERTSYQRQLRLLVSVFLVCTVLSFSGCRGKNLQFFNQTNTNLPGFDSNLSSNQGRGSGSDSLTSLPDDPQLTSSNGLPWAGLGGGFAPAQDFLMAPFGIRSMAALNTYPRTNLVNAAVGGLVDVVTNSYLNKSYVEYIARFGGGTTDNEWVSARLYLIPPGFENSETFISFDEGPGMYAAIVTKTTARGMQARGKEFIASFSDIQNAQLSGFDPKVFLELAVYDMEALLYVNGKLATSGHQCDRNDPGEFGIGGTNGGTIYTMDAIRFNSAPRVFQDYYNQSTANSEIYLNPDWQAQRGFFNRMPYGNGAVAVPIPDTLSTAIVPNLQMLYHDIRADVDVRNPLNKSVVTGGVVAKYSAQGHYIGRLKNQNGVVTAQIKKQLADGSRHLLTEIAVPGNFPVGRLRFTVTYEQARGQVLRLYFRPVGAGFEQLLLDTVHNGIDAVGSAGIEAQDGLIDNFEAYIGDDDRRIENPA